MNNPKGHEQNADQIAYWNGPGGQRWARRQQVQDILLAPIADILIDRAKPKTGERIVDVGCGSGATTMAFAQKIGPTGHVLGVDVSGPMLAQARAGAPVGRYWPSKQARTGRGGAGPLCPPRARKEPIAMGKKVRSRETFADRMTVPRNFQLRPGRLMRCWNRRNVRTWGQFVSSYGPTKGFAWFSRGATG